MNGETAGFGGHGGFKLPRQQEPQNECNSTSAGPWRIILAATIKNHLQQTLPRLPFSASGQWRIDRRGRRISSPTTSFTCSMRRTLDE